MAHLTALRRVVSSEDSEREGTILPLSRFLPATARQLHIFTF